MVNNHPGKSGGHRHCDSGDLMVLVCQVTSQHQVTQEPCNSLGQSALRQVNTLPRLVAIGTVVAEI